MLFRSGGRQTDLRRQTSTAPPSFLSHRRREEDEEEDEDERGEDEEEGGRDGYRMRDGQNLGRPASPYLERPRTPEVKLLWGDSQGGSEGGGQAYREGRKVYPPASSMKPSIITELNSKLQQRGKESWSSQRPLGRHRYTARHAAGGRDASLCL